MGVQLNLGINGTVGVVNLNVGAFNADFIAQPDSAYALTGNAAFTVTLPLATDLAGGEVIYFKNLLDETTNGNTEIITIDLNGVFADNNINNNTELQTDTRFETFALVYINAVIGWMII